MTSIATRIKEFLTGIEAEEAAESLVVDTPAAEETVESNDVDVPTDLGNESDSEVTGEVADEVVGEIVEEVVEDLSVTVAAQAARIGELEATIATLTDALATARNQAASYANATGVEPDPDDFAAVGASRVDDIAEIDSFFEKL